VRVLLVNDWVRGEGGTESYLSWVREGLRAAGDDVRLLTSSAGSAADGSADYVAFGSERRAAQAVLQIVNPRAVARVRTAVRAFRPDVVHVSMFEMQLSPAIFAALRGVPTVLCVGNYKPICPTAVKLLRDGSLCTVPAGLVCWRAGCTSLPHWLRDRPRYALIGAAVRQADAIYTCSEWMRRELGRYGVEATHFPWPVPAPGAAFARVPSPEPLLVYCGRLAVEKGVGVLLGAFARVRARVPTARLRIVGEGPLRPALERAAGDGVEFAGRVAPAHIEQHLAEAWALVAPSLWAEPLGFVAPEAIVRGVPVVASATGGLAESVEPGVSGLLVPNGDEDALARALLDVAEGRVFPDRTVPAEAVERARRKRDLGRHVDVLRELLAAACRAKGHPKEN
jgi:glycosyltransferase involved in cell wall biosynthesis